MKKTLNTMKRATTKTSCRMNLRKTKKGKKEMRMKEMKMKEKRMKKAWRLRKLLMVLAVWYCLIHQRPPLYHLVPLFT